MEIITDKSDDIIEKKYIPPIKFLPIKSHEKNYKQNQTRIKKNPPIENRKNFIKKKIFPAISDEKLKKILIDDESYIFITFAETSQIITNFIFEHLKDYPCPYENIVDFWGSANNAEKAKNLSITEMTAGVGGNVLNFAKYFKLVHAIEIDKTRCKYLETNISIYNFKNIKIYNEKSYEFIMKSNLALGIVFFDPPWGGSTYKIHNALRLSFEGLEIENICINLFEEKKIKMMILKLPNNYDFVYFRETLKKYSVYEKNMEKMTIILLKNYS